MKTKIYWTILIVVALMVGFLIWYFGFREGTYTPTEVWVERKAEEAEEVPEVALPNPASVYCEEQGFRLEVRTDQEGNQYGVCIFPDGSECEEWAYFRGQCQPGEQKEKLEEKEAEEVKEDYTGWEIFTNQEYGYKIKYPKEAKVENQGEGLLGVTPACCVEITYKNGYVVIDGVTSEKKKELEEKGYGYICGRTGAAYEKEKKKENVTIEGKTYVASGFEEKGPGETLDFHNETLWIDLGDGRIIEYGAAPDKTATFKDYLAIKDEIIKIVESFENIK